MATILLIDDSTTVRTQLRQFLEGHDFDVIEAEDGAAGVEMVRIHSPELAIVDINMPLLCGIETAKQIRLLPAHTITPIFMLTAETSAAMAAESKNAGATAWMSKPCNLDLLLRGIHGILGMAKR